MREVDAGVFELAIDEERDGYEAGGGWFGEVAGPLVDADGAGDVFGRFDFVGLGPKGRAQERGGADERAEDGPRVHASEFRRGWRCRGFAREGAHDYGSLWDGVSGELRAGWRYSDEIRSMDFRLVGDLSRDRSRG